MIVCHCVRETVCASVCATLCVRLCVRVHSFTARFAPTLALTFTLTVFYTLILTVIYTLDVNAELMDLIREPVGRCIATALVWVARTRPWRAAPRTSARHCKRLLPEP